RGFLLRPTSCIHVVVCIHAPAAYSTSSATAPALLSLLRPYSRVHEAAHVNERPANSQSIQLSRPAIMHISHIIYSCGVNGFIVYPNYLEIQDSEFRVTVRARRKAQ
ncbi:MAG: hypothetical protein V3R41_05005, partial [Gammaproteobacteria bacterium]